jgi:hypothetical protein
VKPVPRREAHVGAYITPVFFTRTPPRLPPDASPLPPPAMGGHHGEFLVPSRNRPFEAHHRHHECPPQLPEPFVAQPHRPLRRSACSSSRLLAAPPSLLAGCCPDPSERGNRAKATHRLPSAHARPVPAAGSPPTGAQGPNCKGRLFLRAELQSKGMLVNLKNIPGASV